MTSLRTHGLSAGSLYKLLFVGLFVPMFVFGLGCGIGALLGHETVKWNGQQVFGAQGLIVGIGIGIFLPILMAGFLWILMSIGIWVWTRVKPLQLNIKD